MDKRLDYRYVYIYPYHTHRHTPTNIYIYISHKQKATTCSAKFLLIICKKMHSKSQKKLTVVMYDLFILTIHGYKSSSSHSSTK